EAATRAPLAPPLPARGERSDSERSEGIRVRGRRREAELVDKPPHPICFASQGRRSQIDPGSSPGQALRPRTAAGGGNGFASHLSKSHPACRCTHPGYERCLGGAIYAAVIPAERSESRDPCIPESAT